jgi:hypothetical protein
MKVADVADDGSFTLERVTPGKYQIVLGGFPSFVKSARVGQTVSDGTELDLRNGIAGNALTITLSSAYATLSGVVNDDKGPAQGAVVILRTPADPNFTTSTMSDAEGKYTIKNLIPRKYNLIVLDEAAVGMITSLANLDDFDDRVEAIELRPKDTLTKDLKYRPASGK